MLGIVYNHAAGRLATRKSLPTCRVSGSGLKARPARHGFAAYAACMHACLFKGEGCHVYMRSTTLPLSEA